MKQITFDKFGPPTLVARCTDTPRPENPSAWEVVVAIEAFTINPSDLAMMMGQYGFLNQPPATIGMEGAGTVVEVGKSVKDLQPGDRVIVLANNNWCEYKKVPATLAVKVPADADLVQMAMLKVTGLTAYKLLKEIVPLKSGEYVLQNAPLSAVGRIVIQLAKHLELKTINLIRRPEQQAAVEQLGGDICMMDEDGAADRIRQIIGKAPVRLALDCVGGDSTERLAQLLNENGTVVNYGMLSMKPCVFSPEHLIFRNVSLTGFWLSRVLNKMSAVDRSQQISALAGLVCQGKIVCAVDQIFSIDQISEAIRRSEQPGREGKVLVKPFLSSTPN